MNYLRAVLVVSMLEHPLIVMWVQKATAINFVKNDRKIEAPSVSGQKKDVG